MDRRKFLHVLASIGVVLAKPGTVLAADASDAILPALGSPTDLGTHVLFKRDTDDEWTYMGPLTNIGHFEVNDPRGIVTVKSWVNIEVLRSNGPRPPAGEIVDWWFRDTLDGTRIDWHGVRGAWDQSGRIVMRAKDDPAPFGMLEITRELDFDDEGHRL